MERDAGEGNEIVVVALPVEDLNKESVIGLRVEVGEGQGLLPGHVLASVGDGLGPLEVCIDGGVEGDTGVGIVLAEALDILETLGFVDGDLKFGGHGVDFGVVGQWLRKDEWVFCEGCRRKRKEKRKGLRVGIYQLTRQQAKEGDDDTAL